MKIDKGVPIPEDRSKTMQKDKDFSGHVYWREDDDVDISDHEAVPFNDLSPKAQAAYKELNELEELESTLKKQMAALRETIEKDFADES
jgi:hypothetical protein